MIDKNGWLLDKNGWLLDKNGRLYRDEDILAAQESGALDVMSINTFGHFLAVNKGNLKGPCRSRDFGPHYTGFGGTISGFLVELVKIVGGFCVYEGEFGYYVVEPSGEVIYEANELLL